MNKRRQQIIIEERRKVVGLRINLDERIARRRPIIARLVSCQSHQIPLPHAAFSKEKMRGSCVVA